METREDVGNPDGFTNSLAAEAGFSRGSRAAWGRAPTSEAHQEAWARAGVRRRGGEVTSAGDTLRAVPQL